MVPGLAKPIDTTTILAKENRFVKQNCEEIWAFQGKSGIGSGTGAPKKESTDPRDIFAAYFTKNAGGLWPLSMVSTVSSGGHISGVT